MIWPSDKIGFKNSSFGLAQQFVLAAGITIAVSMGLLALAISQRIEASMMRTAAEEGALFTEVFLGPSAQDLANSRSLSPESVKKLDDLLAGEVGGDCPAAGNGCAGDRCSKRGAREHGCVAGGQVTLVVGDHG